MSRMLFNRVLGDSKLSGEAVRLFLYLSINTEIGISDDAICDLFGWSQPKVTRVKAELKKADLMAVVRVGRNEYKYYLANKFNTASELANGACDEVYSKKA